MTDETPINAPEPDAPEPDAAAEEPTEQRVPLERLQKVTSENRTLREELDQLRAAEAERAKAEMTELEQERAARAEAEAAAQAAAAQVQALERGGWLRSAATAAGFADPDDAVALVGTDAVDSADAAAERVKALAEAKPHLLGQQQPAGPRPLGGVTPPAPPNTDDPAKGLGGDLLKLMTGR